MPPRTGDRRRGKEHDRLGRNRGGDQPRASCAHGAERASIIPRRRARAERGPLHPLSPRAPGDANDAGPPRRGARRRAHRARRLSDDLSRGRPTCGPDDIGCVPAGYRARGCGHASASRASLRRQPRGHRLLRWRNACGVRSVAAKLRHLQVRRTRRSGLRTSLAPAQREGSRRRPRRALEAIVEAALPSRFQYAAGPILVLPEERGLPPSAFTKPLPGAYLPHWRERGAKTEGQVRAHVRTVSSLWTRVSETPAFDRFDIRPRRASPREPPCQVKRRGIPARTVSQRV